MSITNLRDISGKDCHLKKGLVFRSGALHEATEDDFVRLDELGITTVLDLRVEAEIRLHPDKLPAHVRYSKLLPPSHGSTPAKGVYERILSESALPPGEDMRAAYYEMGEQYKGAFSKAIRLIAHAEEPILFHCQNGKDRTGVLSALILALLRTDETQIYEDYILTNIHMAEKNKIDFVRMSEGLDEMQKKRLWSIMEVRCDYLTAFFDGINDGFGSLEAYAKRALGFDKYLFTRLYERMAV